MRWKRWFCKCTACGWAGGRAFRLVTLSLTLVRCLFLRPFSSCSSVVPAECRQGCAATRYTVVVSYTRCNIRHGLLKFPFPPFLFFVFCHTMLLYFFLP